jgi:hypothetical protein
MPFVFCQGCIYESCRSYGFSRAHFTGCRLPLAQSSRYPCQRASPSCESSHSGASDICFAAKPAMAESPDVPEKRIGSQRAHKREKAQMPRMLHARADLQMSMHYACSDSSFLSVYDVREVGPDQDVCRLRRARRRQQRKERGLERPFASHIALPNSLNNR